MEVRRRLGAGGRAGKGKGGDTSCVCAPRSSASPLETSTILEDRPVRVRERVTESRIGRRNLGGVSSDITRREWHARYVGQR